VARHEGGSGGLKPLWLFLGGVAAGAAGAVLARELLSPPDFDPRLLRASLRDPDIPATVIVPGILGSELLRRDGTHVWLNLGNAFGSHDLSLPLRLPLSDSRDELVPGGLLGFNAVLPRLFGFEEYADLLGLLREAGLRDVSESDGVAGYHIFGYDWRRDIVESARRLHDALEALAERRGDPEARFNLVGHSMGGLVARYYLRYGTAEPDDDAPVTWAGARRVRHLLVVATPNAGSIPALDTLLNGTRVGFSSTTLSATVVAGMPSMYQLLPPRGAGALMNVRGEPLDDDLHAPETWERRGWGPFGPQRRARDPEATALDPEAHRAFVAAALRRAGAFHRVLAREPHSPCPVRVTVLGGDCLPTLARAVVPERRGTPPRFEAWTRAEARHMFEAGDGRVTRSSVLASHLPGADHADCGLPEVSQAFFGAADHHGIYGEPTFQSVLLRALLRPARRDSRRTPG
jgi:pimeloyl-ACP methyl ester carboxylesterase